MTKKAYGLTREAVIPSIGVPHDAKPCFIRNIYFSIYSQVSHEQLNEFRVAKFSNLKFQESKVNR
jgi:hypothetical protein